MRIVITGSPGTGKTKIARELARSLQLKYIGVKDVVEQKKIYSGRDPEKEVDIDKLASALRFLHNKRNYVVEGHLACEIKLPADFIFVLRTHPDTLKKRMQRRKYKKEKINENLMAEMLDYCIQRVEKEYKIKPLELDTTSRTIEDCVAIIQKAIKNKKKKLDSVDYSKELKDHLKLSTSASSAESGES